ncbi:MAG: nucleotidyltransferase [Phycisphaerales bacterium]|nr:MAG: nucleotidyltransferase [Phycisphaerales bacterium]
MPDTDLPIPIPMDRIADFCRRWKITEFALFGSVLRDDFGPESDVDVLVTFEPGARIGLVSFARLERELGAILDRPVDVAMKRAILHHPGHPSHKDILTTARVLYAA